MDERFGRADTYIYNKEYGSHLRHQTLCHPRWPRHPHHTVYEGMPTALRVVSQSRELDE